MSKKDRFRSCLVEETRRLHQTSDVEAIVSIALEILRELDLEVKDLRYLAGRADGKVKVSWTVSGSSYHEELEFLVRKTPEYHREAWFTCSSCSSRLFPNQEVISTAFFELGFQMFHAALEDGPHMMEVVLKSRDGFEAVLRLTIQELAGHFVGF